MCKTSKIEIDFPVPVDLPDGWEQALDSLIGMVCKQYQKENVGRIMWVAENGAKPFWNEPHEPEFDDSIYYIEVAVREDLYGNNQYNPARDELLRKASEARKARRKQ